MSKVALREIKKDVLQVLIDRVPNPVRLDMIRRLLPQYASDQLDEALTALVQTDGKLKRRVYENKVVPNRILIAYELVNVLDYPMKEIFTLGDQVLQRYFQGVMAGAEDMMEKFEVLQAYLKTLERRYADMTSEMTKRYWLNMATLFGVFIGLFSLIIKGSQPLVVDPASPISPLYLVQLNVAQLVPMGVVLLLFVIVLRLLMTRF